MSVRSTRKDSFNSDSSFPKLMKSQVADFIVLIERRKSGLVGAGMIVHGHGRAKLHKVGYYCACWDLSMFDEYHGSVTLENE